MIATNSLTTGLQPVHPGEILREDVLPALSRTKVEIASLLGVSRRTLYNIIDAKAPVTPQMAMRLGKLIGNSPEMWLRLQQTYDLRMMESEMAEELAKIPTLVLDDVA